MGANTSTGRISIHCWEISSNVVPPAVEWGNCPEFTFEVADENGMTVLQQWKGLPSDGHLMAGLAELEVLYREFNFTACIPYVFDVVYP